MDIFGSSCLNASVNHCVPHRTVSSLQINLACIDKFAFINSPVTSPSPMSSSKALAMDIETFFKSGL